MDVSGAGTAPRSAPRRMRLREPVGTRTLALAALLSLAAGSGYGPAFAATDAAADAPSASAVASLDRGTVSVPGRALPAGLAGLDGTIDPTPGKAPRGRARRATTPEEAHARRDGRTSVRRTPAAARSARDPAPPLAFDRRARAGRLAAPSTAPPHPSA